MKKKISLKIWMISKIIPALLLVVLYWMSVKMKYHPLFAYSQYIILACMLLILHIIGKNRDIFDEYASKILNKTDAICFKLTYVFFGIIFLPCLFININSITMGYIIVITLCIIGILRSIIFCLLDSRWF
ncbi:hypothetical protein KM792_08625 [Clostridium tyrobutyricum]|uniref:hypothetical protein n=1 Tax=Clostridium tyrobutyricum TaxID=1519 RepID=UPI00057D5BB1|nr:hypothetical protein [Clostridium tyrobutyricum]MBV4417797.1 hypothetical protein [Clostridium tyrobutyricum]MBV4427931.1 hypothetical protein [Clostridium tyrobutyricum]MBV4440648.1 hypothetical protein [Clostridium tyrobutyricum]MBV4443987.1 hypothetical protein [Clostridium tyrobutyricum]MBV4449719.1 hypothetical protein [Clostridium tyrobutyricum]